MAHRNRFNSPHQILHSAGNIFGKMQQSLCGQRWALRTQIHQKRSMPHKFHDNQNVRSVRPRDNFHNIRMLQRLHDFNFTLEIFENIFVRRCFQPLDGNLCDFHIVFVLSTVHAAIMSIADFALIDDNGAIVQVNNRRRIIKILPFVRQRFEIVRQNGATGCGIDQRRLFVVAI